MDGQLSLFDFPEYLPEVDFETMPIERAAEIIGNRTGLKFKLDESFNKNKESYSAKKKGLEVRIEFANYFSGVRDGRRHLGVDYSFKTQGGACPCESIDEAVSYIKRQMAAVEEDKRKAKLKPLLNNTVCEHDSKALCNRYGHKGEDYKSELIKGFSCSGCCYYCSQAPMHNGKCKWDCRYYKKAERN